MRGIHSLGHGFDLLVLFFPHEDCPRIGLQEHHLSPPYNLQQMKLIRMDISDNQPVWFGIITK